MVTGASSGIGEARRAAASAGRDGPWSRRRAETGGARPPIDASGSARNAHVRPVRPDRPRRVDALGERVLADHGGVDVLVNNAGRSIRRSVDNSYDRFHDFERTMQLNYFASSG